MSTPRSNLPGPGPEQPRLSVASLLNAWRAAAAVDEAALPLSEFDRQAQPASDKTMEAFFTFLRALARSSRRPLSVAHQGCSSMTRDEELVMSLLASVQSGHWELFEARLCWMAPPGPRAVVAAAAMVLAEALLQDGVEIGAGSHSEPLRCAAWGAGRPRKSMH